MLSDTNINLYIVRHGQSITNTTPNIVGQLPIDPLSDLGKNQSRLLRARFIKQNLEFDEAYSSPYIRAINTAEISLDGVKSSFKIANELREYSAGDWIGSNRSDLLTEDLKIKMGLLGQSFLPPNGESLNQVERRASKWLEDNILYNPELIERSKNNPLNIVLFSHGMTIKCLLQYIMGFDRTFTWKIEINNTSVTKVSFSKEGWRLHYINNYSHLE